MKKAEMIHCFNQPGGGDELGPVVTSYDLRKVSWVSIAQGRVTVKSDAWRGLCEYEYWSFNWQDCRGLMLEAIRELRDKVTRGHEAKMSRLQKWERQVYEMVDEPRL